MSSFSRECAHSLENGAVCSGDVEENQPNRPEALIRADSFFLLVESGGRSRGRRFWGPAGGEAGPGRTSPRSHPASNLERYRVVRRPPLKSGAAVHDVMSSMLILVASAAVGAC